MKPVLALRHMPDEGLGMLEDALRQAGLVYTVVDIVNETPRSFRPEQLSGLVVLGGPMNVDQTEQYPFLADEVAWLEQAVAAELPVMGICLGSQLLAEAGLGARVYPNRVKEIGWYQLDLLPAAQDDPLLAGLPNSLTVFQWHGDTFDLPAGAVHLARSPDCTHQAFRFGPAAYGLQFHMELTGPMIDEWLCEPGKCAEVGALDYIDTSEIRRRAPKELPAIQSLAPQVFGRFADMCRRRAAD